MAGIGSCSRPHPDLHPGSIRTIHPIGAITEFLNLCTAPDEPRDGRFEHVDRIGSLSDNAIALRQFKNLLGGERVAVRFLKGTKDPFSH